MKISYLSKNAEELQLIATWYFEEWGHLNSSITRDKIFDSLSSKIDKADDFLCLLIMREGAKLIAVADLKYREHKDYPEYEHWLGGVFVKPDYRGKGYASALIEKAKDHTAELGIMNLYLQCEEHNESLYLKHGFKPLHSAMHSGVSTRVFKSYTDT